MRLLRTAAEAGNMRLVVDLLNAGVPIDRANGCRALENAGRVKDGVPAVQALLAAGAFPQASNVKADHSVPFRGETSSCDAIHAAASAGRPQSLHILLDAESPSARRHQANMALKDMTFWGRRDGEDYPATVKLLLAAGADPNIRDRDRKTPLMRSRDPQLTQLLLAGGADPYIRGASGETAESIAIVESPRGTYPILTAWMANHPPKRH